MFPSNIWLASIMAMDDIWFVYIFSKASIKGSVPSMAMTLNLLFSLLCMSFFSNGCSNTPIFKSFNWNLDSSSKFSNLLALSHKYFNNLLCDKIPLILVSVPVLSSVIATLCTPLPKICNILLKDSVSLNFKNGVFGTNLIISPTFTGFPLAAFLDIDC